jgi:4-amino-4-deoxy-L-arabinose transferase-like glycosyltransferase
MLSIVAALTLAFSPLYWSQAVISEVYALLALMAATLLWLLIRWRNNGRDGNLWLAGLVMGVGLGNHLTLAFVAPAALVLLWPERSRWFRVRALLPTMLLFILGLGVYAYLPLAAAHRPPVNWGDPRTWDRFLWVVTAKQYQFFVFGLQAEEIPARLANWAGLLGTQFGWWGLALSLAGAWWWWQRDRRFVLFCLTWMIPLGIYAFFYRPGDSQVYLISVFLLLALWWAEGTRYLLYLSERLRPVWQQAVLVLIILLPLSSLGLNWRKVDVSDDWYARAFIQEILDGTESNGLIVVRRDQPTFALWYALYAENLRPDIAVVNGRMLEFVWYRNLVRELYPDVILKEPTRDGMTTDDLIHELMLFNYPLRSVYATDPVPEWEEWFDFVQEGEAPIYRVHLKTRWESEP